VIIEGAVDILQPWAWRKTWELWWRVVCQWQYSGVEQRPARWQ